MMDKNQKGLDAIHTMQIIFGFAYSLIGIFIPIYLLDVGYTFRDILLFYIYHNLSLLGFSFLVSYIAKYTGLKKILLLRFPFFLLYFYFLYNLRELAIPLWLLAALDGAKSTMYFVPINVLFGRFSETKSLGKGVAKMMAFPQIAGIFGPFIGGVIIILYGFKVVFLITFILLLLASLIFFLSKNVEDSFNFKIKDGWSFFKKRPKIIIAEIFDNLGGETEGIIWPVFVYLNVLNIAAVGLLGTVIGLGGALFTLGVGYFSDRFDLKKLMRGGAILLMLVWLVRYFSDSEIMLYVTTLFSGFMLSLVLVPYTSYVFKEAKEEKNESFFVFKEVPTVLGRILLFAIAIVLVGNIKLIFPIAGVAYLYFFYLSYKIN